jgi:cobyrinic acid a,c-diamide synthase
MMGNDGITREATLHGAGKIAIVEGVMGLFDGSDSRSDTGSTMELARLLNWPVVLIVPSAKSGRSLAASLRGFIAEAGENRIVGVILNEVGGPGHADYLREAIEPLKIPVLGAIPYCEELAWPERHLGLQASQERTLPTPSELAQLAEKYLDMARIISMISPALARSPIPPSPPLRLRIAIAMDAAFHFYYESNLNYLRQHGADLVEFSPIHDTALPSGIDGLLFGGGFPELFADELSQNQSMRSEIRSAIQAGMPCYAECGGLMLLAEELITLDGKRHPMAGALPGAVEMTRQLNHFGYCTASSLVDTTGAEFRGHEFHYSRWRAESESANLWNVRKKRLGSSRREGFSNHNLHASYVHLHFPTSEAAVGRLLNLTTNFKTL